MQNKYTAILFVLLTTSCGLQDPNQNITDKNIKILKQRLAINDGDFDNVTSYYGKFESTCGTLNGNHFLVKNGDVFYTAGDYGNARIQLCCVSMSIFHGPSKTQNESDVKDSCATGLKPALGPNTLSDYQLDKLDGLKNIDSAANTKMGWEYSASSDDMSSGLIKVARLQSTNQINLNFPYAGPQRGTLNLRKHPRHGMDAWISIEDGQLICQSIDRCELLIRFDDGNAVTFSAIQPQDSRSTALFIKPYKKLYSKLLTSKRVRIEVNIYQEGSQVLDFKTEKFNPNYFN